jgi:hypothetical protein
VAFFRRIGSETRRKPSGPYFDFSQRLSGSASKNPAQIKMLTPRGEHSSTLFYQGDVMGESASTESQPPKLCSWILLPYGLPVKRKSGVKFLTVTASLWYIYRLVVFLTGCLQSTKKLIVSLRISFQPAQKRPFIGLPGEA